MRTCYNYFGKKHTHIKKLLEYICDMNKSQNPFLRNFLLTVHRKSLISNRWLFYDKPWRISASCFTNYFLKNCVWFFFVSFTTKSTSKQTQWPYATSLKVNVSRYIYIKFTASCSWKYKWRMIMLFNKPCKFYDVWR